MKAPPLRLTLFFFSFLGQIIFNGSARDTTMIAWKPLFLKHLQGSTQHETLLVVSPGSLHMNSTLRTLFVYTEFTKMNVFEKRTLPVVFSARCHLASQELSFTKDHRLHFGESFALRPTYSGEHSWAQVHVLFTQRGHRRWKLQPHRSETNKTLVLHSVPPWAESEIDQKSEMGF